MVVRANGAQIVRVFVDSLIHEAIIARDIYASVSIVRRPKLVVIQQGMSAINDEQTNALVHLSSQVFRELGKLLLKAAALDQVHILFLFRNPSLQIVKHLVYVIE